MPWSTVTHARLRAAQGDVEGARRILREILERRPHDDDARRLLAQLAGRDESDETQSTPEAPKPPAALASAGEARQRFGPASGRRADRPSTARRILRLERWLARIAGDDALRR